MNKKRLRKGEGRVQLIACRDKLEELEAAGYGPVAIYERLKEQDLITLSYGGFYEAYRYSEVRKKRRRPTKGGMIVKSLLASQPEPTKAAPAHKKQAVTRQESSSPADNIVSLTDRLTQSAARQQEYQERQTVADEDQASLKVNIDKLIGD